MEDWAHRHVVGRLAELLDIPEESISRDSLLSSLFVDSLLMVELVMSFEDELEPPRQEPEPDLHTVGDLVDWYRHRNDGPGTRV